MIVTVDDSEVADVADQLRSAAAAAGMLAAAPTAGPLVLLSSRLALPEPALTDLAADRPGPSAAIVTGEPAAQSRGAVRVLHHHVVDVATDLHEVSRPDSNLLGLLRVSGSDASAVAAALSAAAPVAEEMGARGSCFAWVVIALVRAGITLKAEQVSPWPWATDGPAPDVREAEAAVIRLTRANRADDGFYSVLVLRRLSKPLSALAARRGWSPNEITVTSLAIGLAAAALFAMGQRWAFVVGAVFLQVSLVVDCSDGEVARLTGSYSRVGAWLDAATDRVKEYAAYAGLAAGAAMASGLDLWWLAAATMTLQTTRHLTDYTFNRVQIRRETADVVRPLDQTKAAAAQYTGIVAVATRMNDRPALRMVKRAVFFPIGERWLVISVTAAFLTPVWTFGVLLAAGILSFAYAMAGRILRSRAWPSRPVGQDLVEPQLDAGPVARMVARASGSLRGAVSVVTGARFGWAIPAGLALVEMGLWLSVGLVLSPGSGTWIFLLLFSIAFHRYDLLYRALAGRPAPPWIVAATLGVEGRLTLLAVLVALGSGATTAALPVVAVALAIVAVVGASVQWLVSQREESGT